MQGTGISRKDIVWQSFKESSWVTNIWDWFQILLTRGSDPALWVCMVFSFYLLIPKAPQPPDGVITFMFILQMIALDVGGTGLNKLAQHEGYARFSFPRIVAYILIGIMFVALGYSGFKHTVKVDGNVDIWIETSLVIIRSTMTIMYQQAMHSLKKTINERIRNLEKAISDIDELRSTVDQKRQETESMESSHKKELQSTVDRYEARLQSMESSHKKELQSTVDRYLEEKQSLSATYEAQRIELQANMQGSIDFLETELESARERLERAVTHKRSLRTVSKVTLERSTDTDASLPVIKTIDQTQSTDTGYVVADNGSTMAITDGDGSTIIATGPHRDRIKKAMLWAIQNGQDLKYESIAQIAQVGLSTVKKYGPEIKQELAGLLPEHTEE